MPPMSTWHWIELWMLNVIPLACYVLVVSLAYRLHRQPAMKTDLRWTWSFAYLQIAVVGALLIRLRSIAQLWHAGRQGAATVTDPELLVAAWCLSVGLLLHVYFLATHPVWKSRGPRLTPPPEGD